MASGVLTLRFALIKYQISTNDHSEAAGLKYSVISGAGKNVIGIISLVIFRPFGLPDFQTLLFLCIFMTPERTEKLQKVLKLRQRGLTVVLENVFDPHNISAVMRTCDSVGIQDIYVLNTKIPKHKKWGEKSSSSAAKWLTIHQYEDVTACFNALHNAGYKIITTWLGEGSVDLYDMDFTRPLAIVFGNEHSGVSDEIRELADGNMMIPQAGIIQSLNISVACAVTLYEAYRQKEAAGHYSQQNLSTQRYDELWKQWSENV